MIFFCIIIFFLLLLNILVKHNLIFNKKLNEGRFSAIAVENILNKVRNNQPLIYKSHINKKIVDSAGINLSKPIYIERAEFLTMNYAKNLWLSMQINNFNLIIFFQTSQSVEKFKNFFKKFAKFFNIADIAKPLKENLLKLNINHNQTGELDLKNQNEIQVKGNFQTKTFFKDYCLEKTFLNCDYKLNIKQTFYNGLYVFFKIDFNKTKSLQIEFSKTFQLNFFDYLNLQKEKNFYLIKSIINDFKYYFFSSQKIKKISLIKIKKSNFYNLKCKFEIKKSEKSAKYFWLFLGKNLFSTSQIFTNSEFEKLVSDRTFSAINKKIEKYFNLKINSSYSVLNFYFNKYLPEKIILEGIINNIEINYNNDEFASILPAKNGKDYLNSLTFKQLILMYKNKQLSASELYQIMWQKLLFQNDTSIFINKTELKNYELKLFFENKLKSIIVKSSTEKRLVIGNISYYNCRNISLSALKNYDSFEVRI